ncbi:uncharacterized protein N7458_007587 [Penicillium daleae]|uniref:Uncharacterized protein n=1 Tax=Penicillium daleae TaxID=63821 RepID=A0AAD6C1D9_9EURO|nr:uncharacterized protein N7458_007587 [Penicillium daleae]KAJ5443715.1 hypothetical protein N7458_007587 [Penicillium daleae]
MHHSTGRSNSSTFKPNAALNDDWSQVSDPIERRRMQNELRNEEGSYAEPMAPPEATLHKSCSKPLQANKVIEDEANPPNGPKYQALVP